MSDHNNIDTNGLWAIMNGLITLIIVGCITVIIVYAMRDPINNHFSKKKYSKQELQELTKTRSASYSVSNDEVINGIHTRTGMIYDKNFELVKNTCTSCHSSKLITQNRADRDGWKQMIVWMQETQGLPQLGTAEPKILDYLAEHYAPIEVGRRANLNMEAIEWYVLKDE